MTVVNAPLWDPERHDPVLARLNGLGLTPSEIRAPLAVMDIHFSVKTIRRHLARLRLPENEKRHRWEEAPKSSERPNPIHLAGLDLGKRLVEKPSGFWLDEVPVSLTTLMRGEPGAEENRDAGAWSGALARKLTASAHEDRLSGVPRAFSASPSTVR